jgi:hypothetical protein
LVKYWPENLFAGVVQNVLHAVAMLWAPGALTAVMLTVGDPIWNPVDQISAALWHVPEIVTRTNLCAYAFAIPKLLAKNTVIGTSVKARCGAQGSCQCPTPDA